MEFMVNEFLTSIEKGNPEQVNQRELFSNYIRGLSNNEKTEIIKYLDERFFDERDPRKKNGILQLKNDTREQPTSQSSKEKNNNIPFKVISGYCDIDAIGGFADGRYSVIDVQQANDQTRSHYNDPKFAQEGFERYDLILKMDRKKNYYSNKPIYIRYESDTARLHIGFEGRTYSIAAPANTVTREGVVIPVPGGGRVYRESTSGSTQMTVDIGTSSAKLHLILDVSGLR
ncbi:TPA: hypothetical protein DCZ36_02345 [Candidatus Gracilibacteria bacterium]|nr:hypothetical protein [Candidatus Gracilibacteria bacterium]